MTTEQNTITCPDCGETITFRSLIITGDVRGNYVESEGGCDCAPEWRCYESGDGWDTFRRFVGADEDSEWETVDADSQGEGEDEGEGTSDVDEQTEAVEEEIRRAALLRQWPSATDLSSPEAAAASAWQAQQAAEQAEYEQLAADHEHNLVMDAACDAETDLDALDGDDLRVLATETYGIDLTGEDADLTDAEVRARIRATE